MVCVVNIAGVRLVSGCFPAARGVRTLMSVWRTRRCVITALVETWTMVISVTVMRDTSVLRVASGATKCRLLLARQHSLPSPSVHSSLSVRHFISHRSTICYLLIAWHHDLVTDWSCAITHLSRIICVSVDIDDFYSMPGVMWYLLTNPAEMACWVGIGAL